LGKESGGDISLVRKFVADDSCTGVYFLTSESTAQAQNHECANKKNG